MSSEELANSVPSPHWSGPVTDADGVVTPPVIASDDSKCNDLDLPSMVTNNPGGVVAAIALTITLCITLFKNAGARKKSQREGYGMGILVGVPLAVAGTGLIGHSFNHLVDHSLIPRPPSGFLPWGVAIAALVSSSISIADIQEHMAAEEKLGGDIEGDELHIVSMLFSFIPLFLLGYYDFIRAKN